MAPTAVQFDDFVVGGLLDDQDVTIKKARFEMWDYRGKVQSPVPALHLTLEDVEGVEHDEFLSAGDAKNFVPNDTGTQLVIVGTQQKLNSNTNAVAFLKSLMDADTRGEWAAKIRATTDVSVLDGGKVHVERKNVKRSGALVQPEGARQSQRMEVTKVNTYPWESNGAGPAKTATGGAATAAAPAAANDELSQTAAGVLVQIVAEASGSIKKTMLAGKVFNNADVKALPVPQRNAILAVITKDDFLRSELVVNMGMTFDGTTIAQAS